MSTTTKPTIAPILSFVTSTAWFAWLAKNHNSSDGFWMRIAKKDAKEKTITYAEALDGALCYGWIDGQKKSHDAQSWLQKFTPRRPKSIWSKINCAHVERLIKARKMKPAGLKAIEAAKADGRWEAAYDGASKAEVPQDFLVLLSKNKKAKSFFETLNKTNRYSITWRLQTAKKPETREKRMREILEMLSNGKKFH